MDSYYIRFFATIPIVIGAIFIALSIVRYRRMIAYNRQSTYESQTNKWLSERVALLFLYLFFAGFIVGAVDTVVRGVEPMYFFITVIFLLGAIFVFASIYAQEQLILRLREKTMETMKAFVNAIDMKDSYTKGHSQHVYEIIDLFYDRLDSVTQGKISKPKLIDAAMLHDIGKISISDKILNKNGALSDEEWLIIKTHPSNGQKMLAETCYSEIGDWVLYHHERIDGKGYYGLPGDDIPLESRMIAIADTYSALRTDRSYRLKKSHDEAIEIILDASGTQFDEGLVRTFLTIDRESLLPLQPRDESIL